MSTYQEDNQEFDDQMTLPRHNLEWADAIVKWTRYDYVAMYDYPTTENSEMIRDLYAGDVIHVSRRYVRDDWCLCRSGHILGWVFLKDVRFIVPGARPPHRHPRPPQQETVQHHMNTVNELETQPAYPESEPIRKAEPLAEASSTANSKKSMVNRLIKFFKR